MSMRWMNQKAQPSVPSFYFLLFRINKEKILLSVCFLNYPCNKKYPENKSAPNALQIQYVFMEYLRSLGTENTAWGQAPGHEGGGRAHTPWARPPVSWAHGGPPPLIPAPTHSIFLPKKSPSSSSTSSSSFCCDFRSPCSKLHSQNCFGRLLLGM